MGAWKSHCLDCFNILTPHIRTKYIEIRVLVEGVQDAYVLGNRINMSRYNMFSEKRKEARKRKKQREKDAERGEGGADADEMAADDYLLSQV